MTPQQLAETIDSHFASDKGLPAADLAKRISEFEIVTRDNSPKTVDNLVAALGDDVADAVLGAFEAAATKSPLLRAKLSTLTTTGIVVDQALIDLVAKKAPAVAAGFDPATLAAVLALGEIRSKLVEGGVTAEQVTASRNWMANKQWLADRYNAAYEVLESGGTRAEISASLTAAE